MVNSMIIRDLYYRKSLDAFKGEVSLISTCLSELYSHLKYHSGSGADKLDQKSGFTVSSLIIFNQILKSTYRTPF